MFSLPHVVSVESDETIFQINFSNKFVPRKTKEDEHRVKLNMFHLFYEIPFHGIMSLSHVCLINFQEVLIQK